jgi:hypothetical protein
MHVVGPVRKSNMTCRQRPTSTKRFSIKFHRTWHENKENRAFIIEIEEKMKIKSSWIKNLSRSYLECTKNGGSSRVAEILQFKRIIKINLPNKYLKRVSHVAIDLSENNLECSQQDDAKRPWVRDTKSQLWNVKVWRENTSTQLAATRNSDSAPQRAPGTGFWLSKCLYAEIRRQKKWIDHSTVPVICPILIK